MIEPRTPRRVGEVRIGQIASQGGVVVAQGGAEQNRPRAIESYDQKGKMASVTMIKALSGALAGRSVAVAIENGEGIAMLQDQRAQVLDRRRGADRERLIGSRGADDFPIPASGRPLRLQAVWLHVHLRVASGRTRDCIASKRHGGTGSFNLAARSRRLSGGTESKRRNLGKRHLPQCGGDRARRLEAAMAENRAYPDRGESAGRSLAPARSRIRSCRDRPAQLRRLGRLEDSSF